jgi:hypothetical protein
MSVVFSPKTLVGTAVGEQGRNVISSMTRSFPYPPGALEMINRVAEVVVAVNERPYFHQVRVGVEEMLPEVIWARTTFCGHGV